MGAGEWVLAGLVAVIFAFVILRPDRWGRSSRRRDSGDGGTSGTAVGVDGSSRRGRDNDNDSDNDSDGGSDGGGDGGGGD